MAEEKNLEPCLVTEYLAEPSMLAGVKLRRKYPDIENMLAYGGEVKKLPGRGIGVYYPGHANRWRNIDSHERYAYPDEIVFDDGSAQARIRRIRKQFDLTPEDVKLYKRLGLREETICSDCPV
ncbi:MAG: hypothetical protein A3C84_02580 [Candidatus Ryanbacteria bacterium RIFCSPHIGHO2_02_FULL_48_12]|jgi:hypothetical protein|uniref:Uncharacterized protein n=1 Tax=Candidatus Ryanbacteria bacterium RIFCSPHIGHO2_01_FULL_48_27 TaxID=1802115 RepID=A0A1G2G5I8_9BACT|nr:MAG: hypothetical protein A2756_01055 [Candidatus Ryanbacteria bacterium RIFCSPHIGHO2_01_FULL_48_27]OGZ48998.1 MAG: hypothetical protein A3C84_02580 [Candidatus Ryanbacteria bacterium RIFCSPHIGHO2_02_FULL_48_12]